MKPLSTESKTEEINARLFDLCRHQRGELLEAELITSDEYDFLLFECQLAQGGGSPSPRRLENYDAIRARLTAAEGLLKLVSDTYELDGLETTITSFLKTKP